MLEKIVWYENEITPPPRKIETPNKMSQGLDNKKSQVTHQTYHKTKSN